VTESNPLLDGTLSLKIAGTEYAAHAGALQYESVGPGGFGAASFEVYLPERYLVLADTNIIPAMTSNTAPSGVASASSMINGSFPAWKAFDHSNAPAVSTDRWVPAAVVEWVQYQSPVARIITQYAVSNQGYTGDGPYAPKSWTFKGSNDGSTWVTLDTQINVTSWAATHGVRLVFAFANTTAHFYHRLYITASNDANYVAVGELEMMESVWTGDPFDVPATYPELANEAAVVAKHGTVTLYEGYIVGDPTIAKLDNGESLITVECGGLLDKAKYRQDYGTTKVDTTYDNWQRHRVSDKGFSDTIDGKLRFDVNDGQKFTAGDIAGIFYRVNQGIVASPDDQVLALDFEYDLLLGTAAWHCDIWAAPYYVDTLDSADWTTGLWAKANTTAEGTAHVTLPAGTWRCIAFVSWVSAGGDSAAKHHAELTNLRVNCFDAAGDTPTVDEAIVTCGVVTGLATASDTETIGNPLKQCVIPPSTTHADGLDKLASMYEAPVDWGFWDSATLRIKKRLNSPADDVAIRALAGAGTAPAAYLLDATTPAIDYDVSKYEEGKFDYVRAIFTNSRTNRVATPSPSGSTWPSDWFRNDATNIVARSSRFKFLVAPASGALAAYTPYVGGFAVLTPDTVSISCRIDLTATVPAGTTLRVSASVVCFDEGYIQGPEVILATKDIVGAVTSQDSILQGSAAIPAGTTSILYGVEAYTHAGTGTSTLLFSPVDFHDQFPGGHLRTVCAPSEPPADADVKVGILDLTDRGDLTVDRAFAVATQALAWIDSTLETGTIVVFSPTVPLALDDGSVKNSAYIRASDWVECSQVDGHAPLWISSSHVDVDGGVTTLTIEPYPFDVAESDFGHAHMARLRRWKKARRGMHRKQKAALRKAQGKENRTKLGPGHKRRIHYI